MTLGNNEMKLESVDSVSEAKPNDIEAGKKEEDEVKEIAGDAEGEEEEVVLSPDQYVFVFRSSPFFFFAYDLKFQFHFQLFLLFHSAHYYIY